MPILPAIRLTFSFVKTSIQANIESELKNITQTILNMVRTSAGVSIMTHLRAVAEKNREIALHFYRKALAGEISIESAQRQTRLITDQIRHKPVLLKLSRGVYGISLRRFFCYDGSSETPAICGMLKILSSEYQTHALGKIFRMP